ncbi:universal stress protein [Altibacter sp. HG106]|uniref:universal stress protein n=1 Tax=Altibacter sp. HG106 TaxID=3023937 RepID=UPI00234FB7E7|nr:universal stress protein [Altibacter sp. HG106]MDC7994327.1 universal stress protein [Altibacter sp. HG106]
MKTILVPTDFSPHSENALRAAASIAKKKNAQIMVVHMIGLESGLLTSNTDLPTEASVFYVKLAEKRFSELLDQVYLKDIQVKSMVKKYRNFSEINTLAAELETDLIVMSSHGASGIEELFLGSNTEKVIRTSEIPVLVIKQFVADFDIDLGVFASDFSSEAVSVYIEAKQFFDLFQATMKTVYVNIPGRNFKTSSEIDKLLYDFFEEAGYENPSEAVSQVSIVSDKTVEQGVLAYSDLIDSDVIVVPTHGRRGLSHLLRGSISEDVANHSHKPVLTMKL